MKRLLVVALAVLSLSLAAPVMGQDEGVAAASSYTIEVDSIDAAIAELERIRDEGLADLDPPDVPLDEQDVVRPLGAGVCLINIHISL